MSLTADVVVRDHETDGLPSSGPHNVVKSELRTLLKSYETRLDVVAATGGSVYGTKAAMDAVNGTAINSSAIVTSDGTAANNGWYRKTSAAGTGSGTYVKIADYIPGQQFIVAADAGAGTPNAIVATSALTIPAAAGQVLVSFQVFEANTGSPVTVAFNGGTALTIKTNGGADVPAGALTAGMTVLGVIGASNTFRLISDIASAGVLASCVAAQTAAAASAASANTVVAEALTVTRTYATLAAGEVAVTTAGQRFYVKQATGYVGLYEFERTSTGSRFMRMLNNDTAQGQRRALIGTLAAPVAGVTTALWGADARDWDGRVVPNRLSVTLPTINLLPDPFNPLDEVGTTPAREANTAATVDSLGGNNALQITATAQNQQLTFSRSTYPALPSDTYRMRIEHKTISGGTGWRLGGTSASNASITAGGSWAVTENVLSSYTGTIDIGISSATGNADGVVAVGNAAVYDPLAGESAQLPTAAQELAAQSAGHMKRSALSHAGAISIAVDGCINVDGANLGSFLMTFNPSGIALTQGFTFGGWFDCTEMPSASQGMAMGFDAHAGLTNGANGATHGQIGLYGTSGLTAANAYRPGKLYANPTLSSLANTPAPMHYLVGQGLKFIAMSVSPNGDGTTATQRLYVNGVPVIMTRTLSWTVASAPVMARMLIGAWNNSGERRKTAFPWKGKANGLFFAPRALSQPEMHQMDRYLIANLRLDGGVPAPRKACFIVNGDSVSGNAETYAWKLSDNSNFGAERLDIFNTAVGGSDIGAALAEPRKSDFHAMVSAAVAAGYEKVVVLGRWATNEIPTGDPYSWISGFYTTWRDSYYRPFITETKALGPGVVQWWHFTACPGINGPTTEATAWTYTQLFQTFNEDWRANFATYGADRLIDTGLGTEKMTGPGTFTAETTAGGRIMANWKCVNASRATPYVGSNNRSPAATITLSAASGSAITATATAGTFLYHDLFRKIVAGTGGYGRIVAINGDGSVATLNTTDAVPTAWANQLALVTERDTVARGGGFSATSFTSGNWSIQNCPEEWNSDGIHPEHAGGRNEADFVAPIISAFLATLSGTVD